MPGSVELHHAALLSCTKWDSDLFITVEQPGSSSQTCAQAHRAWPWERSNHNPNGEHVGEIKSVLLGGLSYPAQPSLLPFMTGLHIVPTITRVWSGVESVKDLITHLIRLSTYFPSCRGMLYVYLGMSQPRGWNSNVLSWNYHVWR